MHLWVAERQLKRAVMLLHTGKLYGRTLRKKELMIWFHHLCCHLPAHYRKMTVVLVLQVFSVMFCIFGWRWKELGKKVTELLSLSLFFFKGAKAQGREELFVLVTGTHSFCFAKLGEKLTDQRLQKRKNANHRHGSLGPQPLSALLLQCEWKSAHTVYWLHAFYVTTPSRIIGSRVPTSTGEEWRSIRHGTGQVLKFFSLLFPLPDPPPKQLCCVKTVLEKWNSLVWKLREGNFDL